MFNLDNINSPAITRLTEAEAGKLLIRAGRINPRYNKNQNHNNWFVGVAHKALLAINNAKNNVAIQPLLEHDMLEGWALEMDEKFSRRTKKLLQSEDPPTFDDWMTLPPVNSSNFGVYLVIIFFEGEYKMYAGSASNNSGGLTARRTYHCESNESSIFKMVALGAEAFYLTLLELPNTYQCDDVVLRTHYRVLAFITECVMHYLLETWRIPRGHCIWSVRRTWSGLNVGNPLGHVYIGCAAYNTAQMTAMKLANQTLPAQVNAKRKRPDDKASTTRRLTRKVVMDMEDDDDDEYID